MIQDNKNNLFSYIAVVFIAVAVLIVFFLIFLSKNIFNKNLISKSKETILNNENKDKLYFKNLKENSIAVNSLKKYKYSYLYTINVKNDIKNFELLIPIPINENQKQYILEYNIIPKPSKYLIIKDNTLAKYAYSELKSGVYNIQISGIAQIRDYNINTAKKISKNNNPETDLNKYLNSEKAIESDDPYVIKIAQKIPGYTNEEIVENIYKYIQNKFIYKTTDNMLSAKKAMLKRYGNNSEFSAVMVAMLRARKIPARIVIGNVADRKNSIQNWVEVYFDKYGWVTYNPSISPNILKIYSTTGKLLKIKKHYDASFDDIPYIKSGINIFSPYFLRYNSQNNNKDVNIVQNIEIHPI